MPSNSSNNLVLEVIALWKSEFNIELSQEEARSIMRDMVHFFETLHRWELSTKVDWV